MKKLVTFALILLLLTTMKVPHTEAASDRIAGSHRYSTAVEISKNGWSKADTVVLAIGDNFPDALAGGPLAYKLDAPILLSQKNELGAVTRAEVSRLGAKKAIILGSTAVVTTKVDKELKGMGLTVERIGGRDRYETAALIAKKLGTSDTAFVAYGQNFPDALAVAPYAARKGIPILLSQTNSIPSATKEQLKGKKNTYVIGGSSILSNSILSQMPNAKRIAGGGRFSTASAIIREFQMDANNAYVATGMNFADALTGSVLAAKKNGAILLVEPNTLPSAIKELLNAKKFTEVIALGGKTTVSDEVLTSVKDLMKNESITSALPISVNQEYTGMFEDRSHSKFYKFNLSKAGNIELNLKNLTGATWDISIIDRSGNSYISFSSNDSSYVTGNNAAPIGLPTGEYYVKLTANYYSVGKPFTFEVKYEEGNYFEKERNNTAATSQSMELNKIYTGSMQTSSDLDYYKIQLSKPGNVTIKIENQPSINWDLSILDGSGKAYRSHSTNSSSNATGWRTADVGLPAGTYYIKVDGDYYATYKTYNIEASFVESNNFEKEFNNSLNTASEVNVNETYQGTIQGYGDLDFYKFKLDKAGNINVKALRKSGVKWDYTVYDINGKVLLDFRTGSNPVTDNETTNIPIGLDAGVYYLKVNHYDSTHNLPYTFTLEYTQGDNFEKELNNTALTATAITLNNTIHGSIQDSYEDDYFMFQLTADSTINLASKNEYGRRWTYTVYDSTGRQISSTRTDSGEFAAEFKTVTLNLVKGQYFIKVESYDNTVFQPYSFKITN